jgi:hypothetical protein
MRVIWAVLLALPDVAGVVAEARWHRRRPRGQPRVVGGTAMRVRRAKWSVV